MGKVIGILPASGSATRLGGIPKFCLPIDDSKNLIQWHVELMLEVCDEVHISTKKDWISLVTALNFPNNVYVHEIEPSTMPDAISKMIIDTSNKHLVGMPDTFIKNLKVNFYKEMLPYDSDIVLCAFKYTSSLLGSVGQIKVDSNNNVVDLVDKDPSCVYNYIWGAVSFNKVKVNPDNAHLGVQINNSIMSGLSIKAVLIDGDYIDVGTVKGLQSLYKGEK
jgi:hypothetical protein